MPGAVSSLQTQTTQALYALLPVVSHQSDAPVEGGRVDGQMSSLWLGDPRGFLESLRVVRSCAGETWHSISHSDFTNN